MKLVAKTMLAAASILLTGGISTMAHAQAGTPTTSAKTTAKQPSRAQQLMGDIDPKLAELTDDVLFGDVWKRPGLAKRDRSLITVAALIALNRPEQLRSHIALARQNGVTETEIVEMITQLAFYAGWPNAISAVNVARDVFKTPPASASQPDRTAPSATNGQEESMITIIKTGSQPSTQGSADYFTGSVRVDSRFKADAPARIGGATVTFAPGARTAWHTHPLGQTLIVTAGVGLVQQWGGPVEEIRPGDVVEIPPGVKHWHGASPTESMTHIAVAEALDGKSVEWMEPVSDAQYPH